RADGHQDSESRPGQGIGQRAADRTRLRCAGMDAILVDAVAKAGRAHGERHETAAGSEAIIVASLEFRDGRCVAGGKRPPVLPNVKRLAVALRTCRAPQDVKIAYCPGALDQAGSGRVCPVRSLSIRRGLAIGLAAWGRRLSNEIAKSDFKEVFWRRERNRGPTFSGPG